MAITRYAGRFVAPTRVSRIATAKWVVPQVWEWSGSIRARRFVDGEHRVEFDLILRRREGERERSDLPKDIASVGRKVGLLPGQVHDGADVDERLGARPRAGDVERAPVGIGVREGCAAGVGIEGGDDVARRESDDEDAVGDGI